MREYNAARRQTAPNPKLRRVRPFSDADLEYKKGRASRPSLSILDPALLCLSVAGRPAGN